MGTGAAVGIAVGTLVGGFVAVVGCEVGTGVGMDVVPATARTSLASVSVWASVNHLVRALARASA